MDELRDRLRKGLEAERAAALDELAAHGADPNSERIDALGVDGGFADSAQATAERASLLAQIEHARDRLAAADAALERMDAGTYGTCSVCGEHIPVARLEARPMADRCVSCASGA